MPVRVTNTSGYASLSAIASGLNYAADHGAKVANLSFAVQSYSTVITAAQYFKNKGGVVVNSAGNGGTLDSSAPSDALVSVSATDSTDTLAGWSSYGPYVDLSAPGVGIWTTTMGGGYGAVSGTSFSSPLTAGVAALMMGANAKLAPSQIVSILESTARDVGTSGYDQFYGYGRVNAGAAVLAAAQTSSIDTQPPAVTIASPAGGTTVSSIVSVDVVASDNVGVTRVDLLVNNTLLATDTMAPYAFSWDTTGLGGSNATLVARAYDAAGNSTDAPTVNVTVAAPAGSGPDSTAPTVAIASPTSGTVNGVVSVNVDANDNVGVTRVDLLVNGNVLASDATSPFTFTWDTTLLAGTTATLMARAYDAAGNATNSQSVALNVSSGAPPAQPDTIPPNVSISNPSNGNTVNGTVNIAASATDNVGVASVSLVLDGMTVSTGKASTVSYRWNTRKAAAGMHSISAVATDLSGNLATTTIQVSK
jgi:thermitase